MGYESLSTLVVLVIIAIVMVIWLPRSTVKGMKQVVEHRTDRYSSSLHVLDEESASRFSDERTPLAKGAIMPTTRTDREKNRAYVAQVRALRRAAAKRRSVLAACLLGLTVVVAVLAVVFHFSVWFALIPAVLLAVVCLLGARASAQARSWESKMAAKDRSLRERERHERQRDEARRREREERRAQEQAVAASANEARTDVMEQREIRQALHRAQLEQAQARQRRQELHEAQEQARQAAEQASREHAQLVVRDDMNRFLADETNELSEVHRTAAAVDAFDMAVSQDLISFSLGEERQGVDTPTPVVESLEIKSTKQVAKAVPIEQPKEDVQADGDAEAGRDEVAQAQDATPEVNDSVAFHEAERTAAVEAPDETSDSLGADLASILARRGN